MSWTSTGPSVTSNWISLFIAHQPRSLNKCRTRAKWEAVSGFDIISRFRVQLNAQIYILAVVCKLRPKVQVHKHTDTSCWFFDHSILVVVVDFFPYSLHSTALMFRSKFRSCSCLYVCYVTLYSRSKPRWTAENQNYFCEMTVPLRQFLSVCQYLFFFFSCRHTRASILLTLEFQVLLSF